MDTEPSLVPYSPIWMDKIGLLDFTKEKFRPSLSPGIGRMSGKSRSYTVNTYGNGLVVRYDLKGYR